MRLCPAFDPEEAKKIMTKHLTENAPYNAKVTIDKCITGSGWCMKDLEPWFTAAIQKAGSDFFEKETGSYGEGGSIPFLKELGN